MSVGSRDEAVDDPTESLAMLRVNISMDQRAEQGFVQSRRRYFFGLAGVAVLSVVFLSVGWPETAVLTLLVAAILMLQLLDTNEMLRVVRDRLSKRLSVLPDAASHSSVPSP